MNFRILAGSIRPRGQLLALLAASALSATLIASGAQAQSARAWRSRLRRHRRSESGSEGCSEGSRRSPGRASPSGRCSRRRPAAGTAGPADLRALDQVLPQGPGSRRQAGLLHRQGRPHRVRPARHRRRDHRAGRRAEEAAARDPAARHAARARNPDHRRQQRAAAGPLRHLLPERLHVRLRSHARADRQPEEGPEPRCSGDQFQRRAADAAAAARGRIRQGL